LDLRVSGAFAEGVVHRARDDSFHLGRGCVANEQLGKLRVESLVDIRQDTTEALIERGAQQQLADTQEELFHESDGGGVLRDRPRVEEVWLGDSVMYAHIVEAAPPATVKACVHWFPH
jgi:hypothetical protein